MTGPTPLTRGALLGRAVWDLDAVPCGDVVDEAFWGLRWRKEAGHTLDYDTDSGTVAQAVIDAAPTSPNDLHRYLLTVSKQNRGTRSHAFHDAISWALGIVREHSTLYTPRTCACATEAFSRFGAELDELLAAATKVVDRTPHYAVTADDKGWCSDYYCTTLTRSGLLPYVHRTFHGFTGWRGGPPFISVEVYERGLELSFRPDRRRTLHHRTFTLLPQDLTPLVELVSRRPEPPHWDRTAGGWVLAWPPPLRTTLQAWVLANRAEGDIRALARDLLTRPDLAHVLTDDVAAAVWRIAPSWRGSFEDLLAAAAMTTAPAGS